eukprot:11296688-Alexandrium_andersonii.AAC.1
MNSPCSPSRPPPSSARCHRRAASGNHERASHAEPTMPRCNQHAGTSPGAEQLWACAQPSSNALPQCAGGAR